MNLSDLAPYACPVTKHDEPVPTSSRPIPRPRMTTLSSYLPPPTREGTVKDDIQALERRVSCGLLAVAVSFCSNQLRQLYPKLWCRIQQLQQANVKIYLPTRRQYQMEVDQLWLGRQCENMGGNHQRLDPNEQVEMISIELYRLVAWQGGFDSIPRFLVELINHPFDNILLDRNVVLISLDNCLVVITGLNLLTTCGVRHLLVRYGSGLWSQVR